MTSKFNISKFLLDWLNFTFSQIQIFFHTYINYFKEYPLFKIAAIVALPFLLFLLYKIIHLGILFLTKNKIDKRKKVLLKKISFFLYILFSKIIFTGLLSVLNRSNELIEYFIMSAHQAFFYSLFIKTIFDELTNNFFEQFNNFIEAKKKNDNNFIKNQTIKISKSLTFALFITTIFNNYGRSSGPLTILFLLGLSKMSYRLRPFLHPIFIKIIPPKAVERIENIDRHIIPLILAFPLLCFLYLYAFFQKLVLLLSFIPLFKRLSAIIIRQQISEIESSKTSNPISIEIDSSGIYNEWIPNSAKSFIDEATSIIQSWKTHELKNYSLTITADPGMKVDTMIDHIVCQNEIDTVVSCQLTSRINKKSSFKKILEENLPLNADQPISNYLREIEKPTIILIKNIENIFLSKEGGFEAYNALTDFYNISSENVFWLLTFHKLPRAFLRSYFQENLVLKEFIDVPALSDSEVADLISHQMKKEDWSFHFEEDLYHLTARKGKKSEIENVKTHYFRMLWQQSHGNPTLALDLWKSSIIKIENNKITLKIPQGPDIKLLKNSRRPLLFLLGQLLKHGPLSFKDCITVTGLSSRQILSSIRFAEKNRIIFRKEKNLFSINIEWYYVIKKFLISRNYIYE